MRMRMIRIARALLPGVVCMGLLGVTPGCERSDRVSDAPPPKTAAKTPDVVERTGRNVAGYYAPGNPYVEHCVESLLARRDVMQVIGSFERNGYGLARSDCFAVEEVSPGGVERVVIVTMTPAAPGVTGTLLIACIEHDGELTVAPGVFSASFAVPGETGDVPGLDRVPLERAQIAADVAYVSDVFWDKVFHCLENSVPGATAACAVTCYITAIAYPTCVMTCVASQALAAFVRCYVQTAIAMRRPPPIPVVQ